MDPLSDVLGHVRLKSARWACLRAASPWGIAFGQEPACVRFLFVAHGGCWLSVERDPAVALASGSLAVLPHGHSFVVRDQPRRTPVRFEELGHSTHHITCGGGARDAEANVVYGALTIEFPFDAPLLASLPPLIRIGEPLPSFRQNLDFISRELDSARPGAQVVLTRMADVILVQMLRAYIESLPEGTAGFFGALRDKPVASALGLMHQRPEHPWTVALLADEVGLSRSAFAARFAALVGEPPLAYLTRLRMQRASLLLREGATLAKASELAGYASEASFSHAFRQWAGVAPGAYRKRARDAAPASIEAKREESRGRPWGRRGGDDRRRSGHV